MTTWLLSGALAAEPALPACADEATKLFGAGRFVEAARSAESCWARSREPVLLFYAAQARGGAGHATHEVVLLRAYLEGLPATAPQRARAEARLARALTRTVRVTLDAPRGSLVLLRAGRSDQLEIPWDGGPGPIDLEPGPWRVALGGDGEGAREFVAASGARVVVRAPKAVPAAPERFPVVIRLGAWRRGAGIELSRLGEAGQEVRTTLTGERTQLRLGKGAWRAVVRVPGREALQRDIAVYGPREVVFYARLDRAAKARVGLGLGLGTASLVLVAWGGVWVARGRAMYEQWAYSTDILRIDDALVGYGRRMDGIVVLGTGAGALGVALTEAIGVSRKALAIETGIGAGLLVGGAIGYGVRSRSVRSWDEDAHVDGIPGDGAAGAVMGLGAGLVGAGLVSLVTRAAVGRRAEPLRTLGPVVDLRGLGLRGKF